MAGNESSSTERKPWPEGDYHELTAVSDHAMGRLKHAEYGLSTILKMLADDSASDPGDEEHLDGNRRAGLISAALVCTAQVTDFLESHDCDGRGRAALYRDAEPSDPISLTEARQRRAHG
ncbi:MAG TPA: hypothetical protein VFB08_02130 [Burkholderiales bacterium]|nr:hypothetical protein [Burkholderiales bacterium]